MCMLDCISSATEKIANTIIPSKVNVINAGQNQRICNCFILDLSSNLFHVLSGLLTLRHFTQMAIIRQEHFFSNDLCRSNPNAFTALAGKISVIPAQAGIQRNRLHATRLDPGLRHKYLHIFPLLTSLNFPARAMKSIHSLAWRWAELSAQCS